MSEHKNSPMLASATSVNIILALPMQAMSQPQAHLEEAGPSPWQSLVDLLLSGNAYPCDSTQYQISTGFLT